MPVLSLVAIAFMMAMQAQASASLFLVVHKTSDTIVLQSGEDGKVYLVDSEPCTVQVGDSVAIDTNLNGGPEVSGKITKGSRYFNTNCAIWNARAINQIVNVTKTLTGDEQFLGRYADQTALFTYGPGCGLSLKAYERQDVYLALSNNKLDAITDTLILPNGNTCAVTDVLIIDGRSIAASTCPANSARHPTNKRLCTCDVGFLPDADGIRCVGSPLLCPANSTLTHGICQCNNGYVAKNNKCITEEQACQYEHGPYADGNRSQCWCKAGYHFGANNRCVRDDDDTVPSPSTTEPYELRRARCPYGTYRQADSNLCVSRWSEWY